MSSRHHARAAIRVGKGRIGRCFEPLMLLAPVDCAVFCSFWPSTFFCFPEIVPKYAVAAPSVLIGLECIAELGRADGLNAVADPGRVMRPGGDVARTPAEEGRQGGPLWAVGAVGASR